MAKKVQTVYKSYHMQTITMRAEALFKPIVLQCVIIVRLLRHM